MNEFIRHPKQTGAIIPSSIRLADLITTSVDLSKASSVIELGSGTGVFTEKILKNLPQGSKCIVVEANAIFAEATKNRCPQAIVYHDNAVNARKYLNDNGISHCDFIISGLPWAAFNRQLQTDLLYTISDILKPGGKFLTFAYLQGLLLPTGIHFREKLKSLFAKVWTTKPIWLNTPPAIVYCAEKKGVGNCS